MFLYVNIEYGSFYSNESFNKGTCLIVMQIMWLCKKKCFLVLKIGVIYFAAMAVIVKVGLSHNGQLA